MATKFSKYIDDICKGFQDNRGKACCYVYPPLDYKQLVKTIYHKFTEKRHGTPILIVVDNYAMRSALVNYFNEHGITEENGYKYKFLSASFINTKYRYTYVLTITIGLNSDIEILEHLHRNSKFMLSILTENEMNNDFNTRLRNILPLVKSTISESALREDLVCSPVEGHPFAVDLNETDKAEYDKCCEYISTTVKIFGDFSTIEKARIGDIKLGLSSAQVREMIANNNGWNTNLDTSLIFNKQIDEIYNPAALYERACCAYNIMALRRNLVTDSVCKLNKIMQIINDNPDKKILIVSKRGEFAASISKYLNQNGIKCGDYHDAIEPSPMLNDDSTDYIRYKSGEKKGEIKTFASQALSNYYLSLFNLNAIKCLSIKNSSDPKLKTAVDLVIFTSPLCDDIISFKQRFAKVEFTSIPNQLYIVYCRDTIESDKLDNHLNKSIVRVVEEENVNFMTIDENSGDIIL